jgi:hypothetical protein
MVVIFRLREDISTLAEVTAAGFWHSGLGDMPALVQIAIMGSSFIQVVIRNLLRVKEAFTLSEE